MAAAYSTKGSIEQDTTGAGSVAVTMPAHSIGDILIVAVWNAGGSEPTTSTAGWTNAAQVLGKVNGTMDAKWYWKRATATTGEGPTITSADTDLYCIPYIFSGVSKTETNPFVDVTVAGDGSTAETTPDTATVTATRATQLAVNILCIDGDGSWSSGNPPSGWEQKALDVTSTGTDVGFNVMTKQMAATGDVTAAAIGTFSESQEWASITFFLNAEESPTVTLDSPSDDATGVSVTPDLKFTGTDANSDLIDYEVQVDSNSTIGNREYYFDAHLGTSDPNSVWTNIPNAFDDELSLGANPTTYASVAIKGSTSSNFLLGKGTNAPGSGGTIQSVQVIIYGSASGFSGSAIVAYIYTENLAENLGNVGKQGAFGMGLTTLTTPSGGWTWDKLQKLEVKFYGSDSGTLTYARPYILKVEVTVQPIIDALSTDHTGFSAGASHPTASGAQQTYTVGTIDQYTEEAVASQLYNGGTTEFGQTFNAYQGVPLTSATFKISKFNSPSGNIVAKLYAHTGTFGTTGVPTGSALATSGTLDITTLTITNTEKTFTFSSPYTLVAGTKYAIVLSYSGGDSSNYLKVVVDDTTKTHPGNSVSFNGSWSAGTDDVYFKTNYQLSASTKYYWRVRGIDPSGSNTWGEWATRSFTTQAAERRVFITHS